LTNACAQIEMKCNHPRNKWPTFPLFTCSLSFFLIFLKGRKSSVTPRCGVGSLIYKNQILFPNFFIMIVNYEEIFFKLSWSSSNGEPNTVLFLFQSLIKVPERDCICECWYSMTGTLYFRKTVSVYSKLSEYHLFFSAYVAEGGRKLIGIFCNNKDEENTIHQYHEN
jgi:hypothetical protein